MLFVLLRLVCAVLIFLAFLPAVIGALFKGDMVRVSIFGGLGLFCSGLLMPSASEVRTLVQFLNNEVKK